MFPGFCNTFQPNANLKPEEAQNIELLVNYEMREVFNADDKVALHASAFHNNVDNFIEQVVTDPNFMIFDPGITFYRNVNEAELVGFELALNYQWQDWEALVSYGQTRGQDKKTGVALYSVPADKWVLDLNKVWLSDRLKTGLTLTRVEAQDHLPNEINDTADYDHYTLVDLYASWTPRDFDDLSIDLTVNNLTDQKYLVAFEQLYMPGKDIRLSVKYDF